MDKISQNWSPGLDKFTEFKDLWEEHAHPLLQILEKLVEEGTFPNTFFGGHHHPDTKTGDKDNIQRKLQANTNWWK